MSVRVTENGFIQMSDDNMRNPFSGSTSNKAGSRISPPNINGFVKKVPMTCRSCDEVRYVKTEDFRINWECDHCKSLPLLLKIVVIYLKGSGITT